jgi:predicted lipoprotein with Yx(FWY)xxD motif
VKKLPVLGIAAVAIALLAGCGSSKSSSTASTSAAAASTATTSTAAAPAASASTGETVLAKHSKLGTILAAGPKKLTVYLFEADKGGQSACSGTCAKFWPPVRTAAEAQAGSGAVSGDLGTITRSDGTKQVTYKGHPLYFFAKDKDDGDAYGEGSKAFGAGWYVLKPSGAKLDTDASSAAGSAPAGA